MNNYTSLMCISYCVHGVNFAHPHGGYQVVLKHKPKDVFLSGNVSSETKAHFMTRKTKIPNMLNLN